MGTMFKTGLCFARSWLGEVHRGGVQTEGFPIFPGKGPDCVADFFGTLPHMCFQWAETEEENKSDKSPDKTKKD